MIMMSEESLKHSVTISTASGTSECDSKDGADTPPKNGLKQTIKPFHVFMMSTATGIGTGLLIGNGRSIAIAGVGGTLIGYFVIGVMLTCCMQTVGELVVAFPGMAGGFTSYGKRFIDPSVGFTVSWVFFLNWTVVFPLEICVASMTIKFWNEQMHPSVIVAICYVLVCLVNFVGARCYADADCLFNCLKVLMILGFIVLGIFVDTGLAGTSGYLGFKYYRDPGLFRSNGNLCKSIAATLITACFSTGGTEFVALSCAEQNRDDMPKSIRRASVQVVVRIAIIFCVSLTIIGFLVPYDSPFLMGSGSEMTHASPYVVALTINGVKVVPHIVNAIILISILSVANNAMYSSSRTLHSLATQGFAAEYFAKLDESGRPFRCLCVSAITGLFSFIAEYKDQETVFVWLLSISGLSTVFTWSMICVSHLRFRKALKYQDQSLDQLGYRSPCGEYGSYISLAICAVLLVVQFWIALFPIEGDGKPSVVSFFQNYMTVPIAIALYLGHKLYTRNWQFFIGAQDIDIQTDRDLYYFDEVAGKKLIFVEITDNLESESKLCTSTDKLPK
ncbi:unnamed protein product [Kluyveromyces dobzhanskii CBS 2104]|uniref:WGS project CCBQ000000000 data, contig 00272 n=1 Tax=Kluyveromyces dobzhanskii CBS 2104 TaxID=1427455 RepID=A0A0A8L8A9_9SACH|nr:unnamed protein product [Kluyveromyces dobzhanskii CBS 2104]